MICVLLADHALSAVPLKLSPMFWSAKPVTVPLGAASAGSVIAGSIVSIVTNVRSSDTKRLPIRLTIPSSSSFFLFFSQFAVNADADPQ